jgi:hypothetical protein
MNLARLLMIASEVLVGVVLISQYLLPMSFDVSFRVSVDTHVGIPTRWLVPLLLISAAGVFSMTALFKMGWPWRTTHSTCNFAG